MLNEKTGTNAIHIVAFVNQPLAAPHQSFLTIGSEVPLVKKSSFPPGEAKRRLRELIPFNVPIHSGNGGLLKIPIIYKLFTRANVSAFLNLSKFVWSDTPNFYNTKIDSRPGKCYNMVLRKLFQNVESGVTGFGFCSSNPTRHKTAHGAGCAHRSRAFL